MSSPMAVDIRTILATDCGSTTTKAVLIEHDGARYRLISRGEAPTTVEAPFDDVTIGVINAVTELEEITGRRFLRDNRIKVPRDEDDVGVDIYISTSSAGGGLQMMVAGVVRSMTAESAERAALGAGAIVMEVIAVDDGRQDYQKVERIRGLRPDMILLSGGVDGGTVSHVLDIAEIIGAADPKPRFGAGFKLPIIYAGNKDARESIRKILGERSDLRIVENIRPSLEVENLIPAREEIHKVFLEHVMAQAPGYAKLMGWTTVPIMPTPAAFGKMVEMIAKDRGINVIAVDIGGATTDVFSVFDGVFNRTVSANLGMSYSICNVLAEAGIQNIRKWIPRRIEEAEIRNRLRNKMIRPTTIPQTMEDLLIEQAVAREALRLAFDHHKRLAVGLKGIRQERTIADTFEQRMTGESLIDMMKLDLLLGSGGVLSHAPMREQAAMMMIDAFQPEGITELAVDSIFMMPQLGILSTVHRDAAMEVFWNDCFIALGTCIAPVGRDRIGAHVCKLIVEDEEGNLIASEDISFGDIKVIPLPPAERAVVEIRPSRRFDVGAGRGNTVRKRVSGGVVGIIVDGRGRPLFIPEEDDERIALQERWFNSLFGAR